MNIQIKIKHISIFTILTKLNLQIELQILSIIKQILILLRDLIHIEEIYQK